MATLKLRKPADAAGTGPSPKRAPVRGHANRSRPTLKEAQALRTERDASVPAAPAAPESRTARELREPRPAAAGTRAAPTPRPPDRATDRTANRAADRTSARAADRATDRTANRAADRVSDRTAGRAPDRITRPTANRATDPTADRASGRTARRPDPRFDPRAKAPPRREPIDTGREPTTPNTPRRGPAPNPQVPGRTRTSPPFRPESATSASAPADGTLRLSKRMSQLGIASRREADEWIAKGWVRVDGRVVAELGSRVLPDQHITVDAKARRQQDARVTVLVNKPVGYVSGQAEDGYEPALVLVTPDNQWREDHSGTRFLREHLRSLVPAGRLDIDSVGLLVLTQDGRVARQLIGEDSAIEKEYLVRVAASPDAPVSDDALERLRHGLELDGEALQPAQVDWLNEDQLRFVLTQGKKRQIRRMCEAVGLQVIGLKRVRIGAVMLGDLPPGQWRYLRPDETFAPR